MPWCSFSYKNLLLFSTHAVVKPRLALGFAGLGINNDILRLLRRNNKCISQWGCSLVILGYNCCSRCHPACDYVPALPKHPLNWHRSFSHNRLIFCRYLQCISISKPKELSFAGVWCTKLLLPPALPCFAVLSSQQLSGCMAKAFQVSECLVSSFITKQHLFWRHCPA